MLSRCSVNYMCIKNEMLMCTCSECLEGNEEIASEMKTYIENDNLILIPTVSIVINRPLASFIVNEYTRSGKSLSQFVNEDPFFVKVKQSNEGIWNKMYNYLYHFNRYIYKSPYLFPNLSNQSPSDDDDDEYIVDYSEDVLIQDNLDIYIMYIVKVLKAIYADNDQYINSINKKTAELKSFAHYQVDIRIVPHMIYAVDSKKTIPIQPLWFVIFSLNCSI